MVKKGTEQPSVGMVIPSDSNISFFRAVITYRGHFPSGPQDRPVQLDGNEYIACRGDYVIRLNGSTCLQLWNTVGQVTRLEGDPLQVAAWLQACHDADIDIRVPINENTRPESVSVRRR